MLREAQTAGLLLNEPRVREVLGLSPGSTYAPANPNGTIHESLTKWWYIAEFVPKHHWDYKTKKSKRRMNLFRRRTLADDAVIHESAYQRTKDDYASKLPKPPAAASAAGSN